ncbi:MAG TPA: mitofilin family membrane protein [Candidatus Cybelea sp.]|nr:mitofilin family membrane protein [Candidatus Cybelea sp.]
MSAPQDGVPHTEDESAAVALAALEQPKPRRGVTLRWIGVAVLAVVVAGVAGLPLIRPMLRAVLPSSQTAQIVDAGAQHGPTLEQRIATIEKRQQAQPVAGELMQRIAATSEALDNLQQQVARVEEEAQSLSEVEGRLAKIEQRLLALEKNQQDETAKGAPDAALGAKVAEQGRDIAALNQQLAAMQTSSLTLGRDARKVALIMALNQLGEAVERSGALAPELKAVDELAADAPDDPALATLKQFAATGVPTLGALQASFVKTATAIVSAANASTDSSWWNHVITRVTSVITIRRTGEVAGNTAEAVVARAERRLAAGDLAAAVRELDALKDDPAAADWLKGARAHLTVTAAIEDLRTRTLAGMGKSKPAGQ